MQHLGIPTLDLAFGGEDGGGEYHSIYDPFDDYHRFKDPNFEYGVALAETAGHAILRMADADVLPFDFRSRQSTIDKYAKELTELVDKMRENTDIENQLIKANDYALAADPAKHEQPPVAKAEVPKLDFTPLKTALDSLKKSADKLAQTWQAATKTGAGHDTLNKLFYHAAIIKRWPAAPPMVPPYHLCPWFLYRLWRKNPPRHPRSYRAAQLDGGAGTNCSSSKKH